LPGAELVMGPRIRQGCPVFVVTGILW